MDKILFDDKLIFRQNIETLVADSKFLSEKIEEDDFVNINDFISDHELYMIDRFYEDYSQFNEDESFEMLNILNKFIFNQIEDFAFLTIVKFKIPEFDKVRKPKTIQQNKQQQRNQQGQHQKKESKFIYVEDSQSEFYTCAQYGLVMAMRWLVSSESYSSKFYSDFFGIMDIAGVNGNIEILDFMYLLYDKTKVGDVSKFQSFNEIVVDATQKTPFDVFYEKKGNFWNLNAIKWLHNLGLPSNQAYNRAMGIAASNSNLELTKWFYETGKTHTSKPSIFYLYEDRHLEIAKYFNTIYNLDLTEFKRCFRANATLSVLMAKWMYSTGKIDIETVRETFYDTFNINKTINVELLRWMYSLIGPNPEKLSSYFYQECYKKHISSVKFIYDSIHIDQETLEDGLYAAVYETSYEIVKFLSNTGRLTEIEDDEDDNNNNRGKLTFLLPKSKFYLTRTYTPAKKDIIHYASIGHYIPIKILAEKGILQTSEEETIRSVLTACCESEFYETLIYLHSLRILSGDRIIFLIEKAFKDYSINFLNFFDEELYSERTLLVNLFNNCCINRKNDEARFYCFSKLILNSDIEDGKKKALKSKNYNLPIMLDNFVELMRS